MGCKKKIGNLEHLLFCLPKVKVQVGGDVCVEKCSQKHYLLSTSEPHSTDPCKDKTLKLFIVARWKQRLS